MRGQSEMLVVSCEADAAAASCIERPSPTVHPSQPWGAVGGVSRVALQLPLARHPIRYKSTSNYYAATKVFVKT